jgi:hypothetical protein
VTDGAGAQATTAGISATTLPSIGPQTSSGKPKAAGLYMVYWWKHQQR